jgi:2Fe-2S ferredoxin
LPKVNYIESDGTKHSFDIESGQSVMQGAVANGLTGIVADCGGGMACATCHVYVDEGWMDVIPQADDMEREMLDCVAATRNTSSRLSCQIEVSDAIDNLIVRIPETQY